MPLYDARIHPTLTVFDWRGSAKVRCFLSDEDLEIVEGEAAELGVSPSELASHRVASRLNRRQHRRVLDGKFHEMAAAYLYHLARNHPFVDGNKRTALVCSLVFLGLNGERLQASPDDLFQLVDGVAAGAVTKADVAVFLRRNCVRR